ncbi:MAG TPA: DUF4270 domain-containing protein [Sphingobacteriaceae bacterium]|nr:DUF4270 domain-containing protein [Sphingobacteriaceae bacterium]
MKYIKQDLLTLLISLFIFSACNNPDSIGLEVDPQYAINGIFVDTFAIRSNTVTEDTVSTVSLKKYPLGYIKDPVFGTTEANIALSLALPGDNQTFGTKPTLDSAVLVLRYADFNGDSLQSAYKINVHQLQKKLDANVRYSNRSVFNFNNTVIGTKLVRVSLRDSVNVKEIVKGKPDVAKNKAPQVRIPISSSFITNNFLNAASANFVNNTAFTDFIKGLYVTIDKTQSTGTGGILFFDLASDNASALEIYYKSESGASVDTTMLNFKISGNAIAPVAANVFHNYTGTPVQTQLNNPNQQFATTYVQGLAGLRTKVNFPSLTSLKSLGNITINKAELVIDVEGGAVPFTPIRRLILYRTDIANQRQSVPDLSSTDSRAIGEGDFGGIYDSVNKRYKFSITSYVQDIVSGRMKQFDTFIAPADIRDDRTAAIFPSVTTAGRSILGTKGNPTFKMKLNIIYTKTNN